MSYQSRKLAQKRSALFCTLFTWLPPPPDQPGPYRATLKHESMRGIAEYTWPDHGVCMKCMTRGISGGHCKCCGYEPPLTKQQKTAPSLASAWGPIVKTAAQHLRVVLNKSCTEVVGKLVLKEGHVWLEP